MRIIVDTREQRPYTFAASIYDCEVVRSGLSTGDYSIEGFEDRVAIERKELGDLIGCLSKGRKRFERELARGAEMDMFWVVVEATMSTVELGHYRSMISPKSAMQSILTFQMRYRVPFVWATSRQGGEYCTYWGLQKFVREQTRREGSL